MDRILVRSAVVRVLFVVLLVLVGLVGTAHASPPPRGAGVGGGSGAGDLRLSGALFTPSLTDAGIDWHAQWVVTPESAAELQGGATRELRFALPLAEGDTVEPTWGVAPRIEGGRVVGLLVDKAAADGRTVSAVVHQRAARGGATLRLGAPVGAGTALQIIDGDLGADTRLEVEIGRVLERGVGHVAPPGTSHAAREEARRLTGYGARVTGAAMYVRGDDVVTAGGLTAVIVTPRERGHRGAVAIAVVFAVVVAGLFAAVRKLRHAASVERADALLAAEVDALDGGARS